MTRSYAGDALSDGGNELYQVCASLDDKVTAEREIRALWEAMKERGSKKATIITLDTDRYTLREEDMQIEVILSGAGACKPADGAPSAEWYFSVRRYGVKI